LFRRYFHVFYRVTVDQLLTSHKFLVDRANDLKRLLMTPALGQH
jgi:hypothetical protein